MKEEIEAAERRGEQLGMMAHFAIMKKSLGRMQRELMAMYRREKVNPVSGCLPIALQIPVFFAPYKVLFIYIEIPPTPFLGCVKDLSRPDPLTFTTLFSAIPRTPSFGLAHCGWQHSQAAPLVLPTQL